MRILIVLLIVAALLVGCAQQKVEKEKPAEIKQPEITEQQQETLEEEINDDGLDEALEELEELGS